MTTTKAKKTKITATQIADLSILELEDEERYELYAQAFQLFDEFIKDDFDFQCTLKMVQAAYNHEEMKQRSLKEALQNFFRYLIAVRANELGVTEKTMRAWAKRHGLGILRNDNEGNKKMWQRLAFHQRIDQPGTRKWIQDYRTRRKAHKIRP